MKKLLDSLVIEQKEVLGQTLFVCHLALELFYGTLLKILSL